MSEKFMKAQLAYAYSQLKHKQIDSYLAEMYAAEAKSKFEEAKIRGIQSGLIAGKNNEERGLAAVEQFPAEFADMQITRRRAGRAKLKLQLAQLDVDLLRALLRTKEIEVGRLPDAGH